jgi:NAD(P)-dependent dehydrogenase (short-subunit alcohol dehydrogenase family)
MRSGGGGSIVITSSGAGVSGAPGLSAYVASKHAVIGLMRTATHECAKYSIRVNTVNPGPVETRMMRSIEDGAVPGSGTVYKEKISVGIPMRRYGMPDEVANMMLFLASDDSSYCTGSVYMVDGGGTA